MEEKKIETKDDWRITTNRYVTFIDIMGFKDMVFNSPHEEIYRMMKKMDDRKKFSEDILWGKTNSKLVRTTTYSDSIMIYSKDSTYNSLYSIICTTSSLIADLFFEKIPFKGSMAFGKMTLDAKNSIFFGKPLIDAYLLQEEMNFYGIICHANIEEKIDDFLSKSKEINFKIEYLCPLKNGATNHLTIYPMDILNTKNAEEDKKRREKMFDAIKQLRYKTSGHLRKYIDNTETYLKKVIEQVG